MVILASSVILAAENDTNNAIANVYISIADWNYVLIMWLNKIYISQITLYLALDSVLRFKHLVNDLIRGESLMFGIFENYASTTLECVLIAIKFDFLFFPP
jgi:hypothetical protein